MQSCLHWKCTHLLSDAPSTHLSKGDNFNREASTYLHPWNARDRVLSLVRGQYCQIRVIALGGDICLTYRWIMNGWATCNFYALFNTISVISDPMGGDNERLYAMELRLQLERFSPPADLESGTVRLVSQHLTGVPLNGDRHYINYMFMQL